MKRLVNKTHAKGLGTALRTLTLLPWPWEESKDLSASLPWFPVVGLFLGALVYGTALLWICLPFVPWPAGAAIMCVLLEALVTRGLHLDGLADWADSIGASNNRERRLMVMKDASLGAFGCVALIMDCFLKWAAFERLFSSGSLIWVLPVFVLSRAMMVELITTRPYARKGEGMAGPFFGRAQSRHRFLSHALSLLFCLPFGPLGLLFLALAWVGIRGFGAYGRRQYGGITGDLLGTANEMVEVGLLMICALPGERVLCYTGWTWALQLGQL